MFGIDYQAEIIDNREPTCVNSYFFEFDLSLGPKRASHNSLLHSLITEETIRLCIIKNYLED